METKSYGNALMSDVLDERADKARKGAEHMMRVVELINEDDMFAHLHIITQYLFGNGEAECALWLSGKVAWYTKYVSDMMLLRKEENDNIFKGD